jgi:peptidoglycan/xylan/chitin deacetylase (PgdA/CDA1 family)
MTIRWRLAAPALLLWTTVASAAAATELAVTVDDLPAHGALPPGVTRLAVAEQMIRALHRHEVPRATGFTNGELAREPELAAILRAWQDAGFVLANHTYSHLDLARSGAPEYVGDIERNEEALARFAPADARYFRYPYLHEGESAAKRETVRQWLRARGYTIAPVTVSLPDEWSWNDVYVRCVRAGDDAAVTRLKRRFLEGATSRLAAFEELSRRLFARPIKHVLMVHLGAFDAVMLDDVLRAFRAAGARFIALDEAMRDPAYRIVPAAVGDGGATLLVEIAHERHVPLPAGLGGVPEDVTRLCRWPSPGDVTRDDPPK